MRRRQPRSKRTETRFPYTTLVRSLADRRQGQVRPPGQLGRRRAGGREQAQYGGAGTTHERGEVGRRSVVASARDLATHRVQQEISRAHVSTPVTNQQHVCRLLLQKKNPTSNHYYPCTYSTHN